jgi:integrase
MKPGTPPLLSVRLLDQVRERIRYLHYSLSTEKTYLYWIRFFIRWHGLKHPRDMGAKEVEAFLTMMATQRKVSASTHNQALSALLFLYREVLNIELPWLNDINRPTSPRRIPSVLTRDEVAGVLAGMEGETALLARLLYGTGKPSVAGLKHPTRWRPNTPRSVIRGRGSGCFRRPLIRSIHEVVCSADTICMRTVCSVP